MEPDHYAPLGFGEAVQRLDYLGLLVSGRHIENPDEQHRTPNAPVQLHNSKARPYLEQERIPRDYRGVNILRNEGCVARFLDYPLNPAPDFRPLLPRG